MGCHVINKLGNTERIEGHKKDKRSQISRDADPRSHRKGVTLSSPSTTTVSKVTGSRIRIFTVNVKFVSEIWLLLALFLVSFHSLCISIFTDEK